MKYTMDTKHYIAYFYDIVRKLNNALDTKYFHVYVTILCATIIGIFFTPKLSSFINPSGVFYFHGFWHDLKSQSEDLFHQNLFDNYPDCAHHRSMYFRLTFPIIIKLFNLNIWGMLAVQKMFGLLLFFYSSKVFYKITKDKFTSLCFSLSCTYTYTFINSLTDNGGNLTGIDLALLLMAVYYRNCITIFITVFLASFHDEKALISSALVLLYWAIKENNNDTFTLRSFFNPFTISIISSWVLYFVCRFTLQYIYEYPINTTCMGLPFIRLNIPIFHLFTFNALKALWVLPAFFIIDMCVKKNYLLLLGYSGIILIIFAVSASCHDFDRSLCHMFITLFPALLSLVFYFNTKQWQFISFIILIMCILIPNYNIIMLNLPISPIFIQWLEIYFDAGKLIL